MNYVIIYLVIYFLPTIVAFLNKKVNAVSIMLVNIFLGWTIIGWIVALVWAFSIQQIDLDQDEEEAHKTKKKKKH